jgi:hypothetical protein
MSRITWISFPRSADTSVIKSMVDSEKIVKVKNPIGAEINEYTEYRGDKEDFEEISLVHMKNTHATERVFDNPFLYVLYGGVGISRDFYSILDAVQVSKDEIFYFSTLGQDDFDQNWRVKNKHLTRELREEVYNRFKHAGYLWVWIGARCTKQLYDLIKHNTKQGEKVEIYTLVLYGEEGIRAPKNTTTINLEDVLKPDVLATQVAHKTIILNTGEQACDPVDSPLLDTIRSNIKDWIS